MEATPQKSRYSPGQLIHAEDVPPLVRLSVSAAAIVFCRLALQSMPSQVQLEHPQSEGHSLRSRAGSLGAAHPGVDFESVHQDRSQQNARKPAILNLATVLASSS